MALKRALPLLALASSLILFVVLALASADAPAQASPVQHMQSAPAITDTPTPVVCGQVGNYLIATSTATIVPGTYDIGNHCDDCQTNLSLPFPFQLYDQVGNNIIVTSNGWAGSASRSRRSSSRRSRRTRAACQACPARCSTSPASATISAPPRSACGRSASCGGWSSGDGRSREYPVTTQNVACCIRPGRPAHRSLAVGATWGPSELPAPFPGSRPGGPSAQP